MKGLGSGLAGWGCVAECLCPAGRGEQRGAAGPGSSLLHSARARARTAAGVRH